MRFDLEEYSRCPSIKFWGGGGGGSCSSACFCLPWGVLWNFISQFAEGKPDGSFSQIFSLGCIDRHSWGLPWTVSVGMFTWQRGSLWRTGVQKTNIPRTMAYVGVGFFFNLSSVGGLLVWYNASRPSSPRCGLIAEHFCFRFQIILV